MFFVLMSWGLAVQVAIYRVVLILVLVLAVPAIMCRAVIDVT